MPTYEYVCEQCGKKFEKLVHFDEDPDKVVCPEGHLHVRRVFSAPAIVFKGKGFYITDNRPSHKSSSSDSE
jgi:putative FmdB family regulatory protein